MYCICQPYCVYAVPVREHSFSSRPQLTVRISEASGGLAPALWVESGSRVASNSETLSSLHSITHLVTTLFFFFFLNSAHSDNLPHLWPLLLPFCPLTHAFSWLQAGFHWTDASSVHTKESRANHCFTHSIRN